MFYSWAVILYLISERKPGILKLRRSYSYYPLIFGKLENNKMNSNDKDESLNFK